MSRIKVFTLIIALGIGIAATTASPAMAINRLRDISVQKAGDSVVVIISTTEPCEFNPFLTDSKPERVVVDLDGVINAWTVKKFMSLPTRSIQAIRTSQYKAQPDLVARVVLDIGRPIDFRSFQNGSDIIIKLPAVGGETDFAEWHATRSEKPSVRVASKPAEKPAVKEKAKTKQAEPRKRASGVELDSYPKRKLVSYSTSKYRDPFEPLVGGPGGQVGGELPVIENLALVGILTNEDGNVALLEDAEGNGYMMMPRDRVKNGYLVSVSDNKAIFQITEYGWTRTVALELEVPEIK